jgi:hypothetical protein
MDTDAINKAIMAHGAWKARLSAAIETGSSEFSPEKVAPDNLCDFGKWLYGLATPERASTHFKTVQGLHAAFHKEASGVLRQALSGQKAEAQKSMGFGGEFSKISAQLIQALGAWKRDIT